MTDTTKKMLETAQTLDKSILDAVMDGNRKWIPKNQKLNKAHKSLHEVIETLIELATEEELEQRDAV